METGTLLVGLIINFGLSFIVANIAERKGRSFWGFWWLSFLLSFFIGILVAIAIPDESKSLATVDKDVIRVKCPHCAEQILAEATVCKHCGRDVEARTDLLQAAEEQKVNIAMAKAAKQAENQIHSKRANRISVAIVLYIFGALTLLLAISVSNFQTIAFGIILTVAVLFIAGGSLALYRMPPKPGSTSLRTAKRELKS